MKINKKLTAFLLAASMGFSSVFAATPAQAGATGRRNTALGLGAASIYAYSKGKKKAAVVGALGTAYAYKRYSNSKKREKAAKSRRNRVWCKNHRRYEYR